MITKKLCVHRNIMPHYRSAIYSAMDKVFDCDWFYGKKNDGIKEMDISLLKRAYPCKSIGNPDKIYWQFNLLPQLFRKYNTYLLSAESRSIPTWIFIFLSYYLFPKKRVYTWCHGWYGRESKFDAKMKLWRYRHLDGIFVYGNYAKNLLIEHGIDANKLYVIHNSLDYERQLVIRNKLQPTNIYVNHFNNHNYTIIFIGRLIDSKRIDLLIDALAILKNKGEHLNLILVGDGNSRNKLKNYAIERDLDKNIWFYGSSYDEETNANLIYNADLCVSPGNVGLTAIHSMVYGTPVITHNNFSYQGPEFEAIIPQKTGDFFEMNNVESLAKCIHNWLIIKRKEDVRRDCYQEIDSNWTPAFQMKVLQENLKI